MFFQCEIFHQKVIQIGSGIVSRLQYKLQRFTWSRLVGGFYFSVFRYNPDKERAFVLSAIICRIHYIWRINIILFLYWKKIGE